MAPKPTTVALACALHDSPPLARWLAGSSAMKDLDTHLWNLGTVAAIGMGVAACGPAVAIDDSSGSDSDTESDTIIDPSAEGSDTEVDPPGCTPEACGPGYVCIDGQCTPDEYEYECDYGDCYCVYGHCTPPYYYDCYDDLDCGPGEVCAGGYCDPVQTLPACDGPAQALEIPISIPTDSPIASLSFVDLDPDEPGEALVVGTDAGTFVLRPDAEPEQLPATPSAVRDAIAADLDQDGEIDIALLHDQGLTVLYSALQAPFPSTASTSNPPTSLEAYRPADGVPGLIVRTTANDAWYALGLADRMVTLQSLELSGFQAAGLAGFDDGAGSMGFILNGFSNTLSRLYFDIGAFVEIGSYPSDATVRELVTGQLGAGPPSDAVWATVYDDWTRLELSLDVEQPLTRALYFDYPRFATGDLDGDGLDDVLGLGEAGFVVMPGDAKWGMVCFAQGPLLSGAPLVLALGDYDGDGRADLATTTQTGALALYDVSWTP